jgi:3-hydroxyisobutyrate dehydrogenase-like beta-hydroxyacid dehydrogenase
MVIGVIGLGQMGLPMAQRLAAAGHEVICQDDSSQARAAAEQSGLVPVDDARAVAERAAVVLVMVPSRFVADVLTGERGVVAGLRPGCVVVEGGNSDPRLSAQHAATCELAGASMLDVGFSGGPLGAAEGTLAVMVGGDRDAYDRTVGVFDVLGSDVAYFGPSGSGHLAKALNHLVQGLTAQAIGEALAVASAVGIDLQEWTRVASKGAAGSWLMERAREMLDAPPPDPAQVNPWWSGHGARNQLSFALEAAENAAIAVPLAAAGHQIRTASIDPHRQPAVDFYVRLTWELANRRS